MYDFTRNLLSATLLVPATLHRLSALASHLGANDTGAGGSLRPPGPLPPGCAWGQQYGWVSI